MISMLPPVPAVPPTRPAELTPDSEGACCEEVVDASDGSREGVLALPAFAVTVLGSSLLLKVPASTAAASALGSFSRRLRAATPTQISSRQQASTAAPTAMPAMAPPDSPPPPLELEGATVPASGEEEDEEKEVRLCTGAGGRDELEPVEDELLMLALLLLPAVLLAADAGCELCPVLEV